MTRLQSYLAKTRIGHVEGLGELNANAVESMSYLCKTLARNANLKMVLIRSLNKSCEAITLDDTDLIVIDIQITKCFATLTRCLSNLSCRADAIAYLSKLMAEEGVLLLDDRTIRLGYGNFYRLNNSRQSPRLSPDSPHEKYLGLNDLVLAMHECTHYLLKHGLDASLASISQLFIEDDRPSDWRRITREAFGDAFASDYDFNLYANSVDEQELFIHENRDKLRDEIACDIHALTILQFWCLENNVSPIEAFRSAWLCLKHMRLLQCIRRYAREMTEGLLLTGVDDHIRLLDVRIWRLLNIFCNTWPKLDASVDSVTLGKELIAFGTNYDERITQPLVSVVVPHFQSARIRTRPLPLALAGRVEFCCEAAAKFGWRPRASTFEHFTL
jgi:hypothetical protein